ncbi:hypothetical protein FKM82_022667 [Ascaphus truei]
MSEFLHRKIESLLDWDMVWSKYAKKLSDLAEPENTGPALQCLNELIMNALHHIPDVLNFLSRVKNQNIFRAFAISQVMAIATLSACCSNQQVFKGVVKIRKGQTITFMMDVSNLQAVKAIMYQYVEEINQKMSPSDLLLTKTDEIITVIKTLCLPMGSLVYHNNFFPVYVPCVVAIAALIFLYFCTMSQVSGG